MGAVVVALKEEKTRRQIEADYESTIKALAKTLEYKTKSLQIEFARNCDRAELLRDNHMAWLGDEGQG
jgi:hypothetical protein